MDEPLSPALEQRAQELATRLHSRVAGVALALARRLVTTTEETLFGDTEFALRDQALALVGQAYAEHLGKKGATSVPASTAPSVARPPRSTATAPRRSRRSAGRSRATAPTTTVAPVATAAVLGTSAPDSKPIASRRASSG